MARVAELHRSHLAREEKRRTEDPRLLEGALSELGTAQPAREAEIVADARARPRLAPDGLALDDERIQPLRRCVDRSREAGRPGSDDHDVERPGIVQLGLHARPVLREVLGSRIDERGAVRQQHDRNVRAFLAARAEELHALVRVGRVEGMRHAVPREQVAERIAARRPRVCDDRQLAPARRVLTTPLLQELRHEPVEELVGPAERLQRVVVDVAERHRRPDRVRGLLVRPAAPRDQQRALGVRMQLVNAGEQLLPLDPVRSAGGQHDRDSGVLLAERLELRQRGIGRRSTDDPVVTCVALELAGDPLECLGVLVDGEDERKLLPRGDVRHGLARGHRVADVGDRTHRLARARSGSSR